MCWIACQYFSHVKPAQESHECAKEQCHAPETSAGRGTNSQEEIAVRAGKFVYLDPGNAGTPVSLSLFSWAAIPESTDVGKAAVITTWSFFCVTSAVLSRSFKL